MTHRRADARGRGGGGEPPRGTKGGSAGGHDSGPERGPGGASAGGPGSGPQRGPGGASAGGPEGGPKPGPGGAFAGGPEGGPPRRPEGVPKGRIAGEREGGPDRRLGGGPQGGIESRFAGGLESGPERRRESGPEGEVQGRSEGGPEGKPEAESQRGSEDGSQRGPESRSERGPGGRSQRGPEGRSQRGPGGRSQRGPEAGYRGRRPGGGGSGDPAEFDGTSDVEGWILGADVVDVPAGVPVPAGRETTAAAAAGRFAARLWVRTAEDRVVPLVDRRARVVVWVMPVEDTPGRPAATDRGDALVSAVAALDPPGGAGPPLATRRVTRAWGLEAREVLEVDLAHPEDARAFAAAASELEGVAAVLGVGLDVVPAYFADVGLAPFAWVRGWAGSGLEGADRARRAREDRRREDDGRTRHAGEARGREGGEPADGAHEARGRGGGEPADGARVTRGREGGEPADGAHEARGRGLRARGPRWRRGAPPGGRA